MKPLNKNTSALQCSTLTSCFIALADRKLNKKEKKILNLLFTMEEKQSATKTVKVLTSYLECAESTVWSTLRSLRSLRLITQDDEQFLTLSKSARLLAKEMQL